MRWRRFSAAFCLISWGVREGEDYEQTLILREISLVSLNEVEGRVGNVEGVQVDAKLRGHGWWSKLSRHSLSPIPSP